MVERYHMIPTIEKLQQCLKEEQLMKSTRTISNEIKIENSTKEYN